MGANHVGVKAAEICMCPEISLGSHGISSHLFADLSTLWRSHVSGISLRRFWDRLMGTYRPYESGLEGREGKGTEVKADPSRLPDWADPSVEQSSGHVTERFHAD